MTIDLTPSEAARLSAGSLSNRLTVPLNTAVPSLTLWRELPRELADILVEPPGCSVTEHPLEYIYRNLPRVGDVVECREEWRCIGYSETVGEDFVTDAHDARVGDPLPPHSRRHSRLPRPRRDGGGG